MLMLESGERDTWKDSEIIGEKQIYELVQERETWNESE
jgi:hypothetical protein